MAFLRGRDPALAAAAIVAISVNHSAAMSQARHISGPFGLPAMAPLRRHN
jgi:hypothetical protein